MLPNFSSSSVMLSDGAERPGQGPCSVGWLYNAPFASARSSVVRKLLCCPAGFPFCSIIV